MQGSEYKRCKRCGETKALEDFQKHPGCAGGHRPECKACTAAQQKAYRERNAGRIKAERAERYARDRDRWNEMRRKPCRRCGEPRVGNWRGVYCEACVAVVDAERAERARRRANDWYADPENLERRKKYNREIRSDPEIRAREAERQRAWREANWERDVATRERNRKRWRAENPDRVKELDHRRRALARDAFVEDVNQLVVLEAHDGVCGICGKDVDPLRFDVDHIIPLSRGGLHEYANVQPAHPSCNYRKNNKLPDELAA